MSKRSAYIEPQITRTCTVEAPYAFLPDVTIEYRPMLGPERAIYRQKQAEAGTEPKRFAHQVETIRDRLVSWDLTKSDGSAVDPKASSELRQHVHPDVLDAVLVAILQGRCDEPETSGKEPEAAELPN